MNVKIPQASVDLMPFVPMQFPITPALVKKDSSLLPK